VAEIKQIVENTDWHHRLLYASDFPLPGVVPIISSKKLAANDLIDVETIDFLNQVRRYSSWLYDFLSKRFLRSNGSVLSHQVFHTRRHFLGN
ncbi:MAG: amidohydrolase, partial [Kangiellaceae bacterium]